MLLNFIGMQFDGSTWKLFQGFEPRLLLDRRLHLFCGVSCFTHCMTGEKAALEIAQGLAELTSADFEE